LTFFIPFPPVVTPFTPDCAKIATHFLINFTQKYHNDKNTQVAGRTKNDILPPGAKCTVAPWKKSLRANGVDVFMDLYKMPPDLDNATIQRHYKP
jgi:hypothetical protein